MIKKFDEAFIFAPSALENPGIVGYNNQRPVI
jgi:hypothetical protein